MENTCNYKKISNKNAISVLKLYKNIRVVRSLKNRIYGEKFPCDDALFNIVNMWDGDIHKSACCTYMKFTLYSGSEEYIKLCGLISNEEVL